MQILETYIYKLNELNVHDLTGIKRVTKFSIEQKIALHKQLTF